MPELKAVCDGLLLIFNVFNDYHSFTSFFHVCNPATHQYAPLPQIPSCMGPSITGFYWHKPSRKYHVLYSILANKNNDFHVLTVGSDEQRCIGQPPLSVRSLELAEPFLPNLIHNAPVLHRGCLHWRLGRDSGTNTSNILIFDTTVETFRSIRYPAQPGSWPGLLEMDGALALCSTADGIHINVLVMQDYEAEIWAFKCRINLSAVAAPLPSYALSPRMAMLNEREFLIQLDKRVLHCDIDGKLLGNVNEDNYGNIWVTSHFLQESILPLPFSMMQEDRVSKHPFTF